MDRIQRKIHYIDEFKYNDINDVLIVNIKGYQVLFSIGTWYFSRWVPGTLGGKYLVPFRWRVYDF